MRKSWLEYVVTREDEGMTVERIVREKLAVSGRMLQRLTRSKGIQLNRKPPYLKRQVKEGDRISVRIADRPDGKDAAPLPLSAAEWTPERLYEDEWFVVVNKPAGMMVHPVKPTHTHTLVHALAAEFRRRGEPAVPHPVHRLDKETSGAILLAKSGYAHQLADRILREDRLDRQYVAVVTGVIEAEQGTVDAPIGRDPRHPARRCVKESGDSAITHYRVLARDAESTLVRVWLETGRTHQIRVHFAHLGHPLAGDGLYGGERLGCARLALHAERLVFPHPLSKETVDVFAPFPDDLAALIRERYGWASERIQS